MARLLVYQSDRDIRELEALGPVISVGRDADNTLVLKDAHVSRRHFVIEREGETHTLTNLSDTHGTLVDGVAVEKIALCGGEMITAGDVRIQFLVETDTLGDKSLTRIMFGREHPGQLPPANTPKVLIAPDSDANAPDMLAVADPAGATMMHMALQVRETAPSADLRKRFLLLQDIMQEMVTQLRLDPLLEFILDKLFEMLKADNGAILLIDAEKNLLVPKAVRQVSSGPSGRELRISRTLIRRVCQERMGYLCADAQSDEALQAQQSIMAFGIRSAMCVPMLYRGNVLGVIHIDNQSSQNTFAREDLEFLTMLANQAAICVHNARLHDEIVAAEMQRANLGRYFSPQVVDKITANEARLELGGTNVEVSLLYSDIRGFTALSERVSPQDLVAFLNAYFTEMAEIVFEFGGTCDKFIGDALLAVFGSPIPDPGHQIHAVRCAERMIQRLKAMTFAVGPVHTGIGLHYGTVIHGNIGSDRVMQYTVIGDIVNTTARLCSVAGPNQIIMSAAMKAAVGDGITTNPLGMVALKGKSAPVETFELVI